MPHRVQTFRGFRRLFRLALRRWRTVEETDDEIRFHLDRRIETLVELGWTRQAAEQEALRRFGPYDESRSSMLAAATHREQTLTMLDRLDALRHDVSYALRQIRRAPGLTIAVVVSLALGIGANATMFGIIDRLLLRPPPHILAPEQVFMIAEMRHFGNEEYLGSTFSYPSYKDYRDNVPAFATVATAT